MSNIKNYLINNGYTVTIEEHKKYGSYYSAKKKFDRYTEIEIYIANVKDISNLHISIKDKHFAGHCKGYVDKIEDIDPIIKFMTNERKSNRE